MKLFYPLKPISIFICVFCISAIFSGIGNAQVFTKKNSDAKENAYKTPGVWPGRAPGSKEVAQLQSTDDYFFQNFPYPAMQEKQTVVLRYSSGTFAEPLMQYGGAPLIMNSNPNIRTGRNYANDYVDATSNYKHRYEFDYNYSFDDEQGIYTNGGNVPLDRSGSARVKTSPGGAGNSYDYSSGNTYIYNNYYYGQDVDQKPSPTPQVQSSAPNSGTKSAAKRVDTTNTMSLEEIKRSGQLTQEEYMDFLEVNYEFNQNRK